MIAVRANTHKVAYQHAAIARKVLARIMPQEWDLALIVVCIFSPRAHLTPSAHPVPPDNIPKERQSKAAVDLALPASMAMILVAMIAHRANILLPVSLNALTARLVIVVRLVSPKHAALALIQF